MKMKFFWSVLLSSFLVIPAAFADHHFSMQICNYSSKDIKLYSDYKYHVNGPPTIDGQYLPQKSSYVYKQNTCTWIRWDVSDGHSGDIDFAQLYSQFSSKAAIKIHSKAGGNVFVASGLDIDHLRFLRYDPFVDIHAVLSGNYTAYITLVDA